MDDNFYLTMTLAKNAAKTQGKPATKETRF